MSTAQGIERRDFLGAPPSIDLLKRTVEYVASTEKLDSHGTIVRQKWQLDKYKKNPIFLYMHDADDPIGSANVRVENGKLIATVKYAENDECAEKCWNLVKQGVLRAVSVGFRPLKRTYIENPDGSTTPVYEENELVELSQVSIGSNEDALARGLPLPTVAPHITRGDVASPKEDNMSDNPKGPALDPAAAPATPPDGDVQVLRAMVLAKDSEIQERDDQLSIARALISEKEEKIATLETELTESRERDLTAHVRSFEGKKFLSRQFPAMLGIARASRKHFDEYIQGLPELRLFERTISADSKPRAVDPQVEFDACVARHVAAGFARKEAIEKAAHELGGRQAEAR